MYYLRENDDGILYDREVTANQMADFATIQTYIFGSGAKTSTQLDGETVQYEVTNYTFVAEVEESKAPTAKLVAGTDFHSQMGVLCSKNTSWSSHAKFTKFLSAEKSQFDSYLADRDIVIIEDKDLYSGTIVAWATRSGTTTTVNNIYWWSPVGNLFNSLTEDEQEAFKIRIQSELGINYNSITYTDSSTLHKSVIRNNVWQSNYIGQLAIISVTDTDYPEPVFAWFVPNSPDGKENVSNQYDGTVYWYSKEKTPLVNENSGVSDNSKNDAFFANWTALTDVSGISDWDFSKVQSLHGAFRSCSKLQKVEFNSSFERCTNLSNMFCNCSLLVSVTNTQNSNMIPSGTGDCSSFDQMFSGCSALTTISFLKGADLSNCYNVYRMFYNCKALDNQTIEDVIHTWTFDKEALFLNKSGDHRHMHKESNTTFPEGIYECANGNVKIYNGGQFAGKSEQNAFTTND